MPTKKVRKEPVITGCHLLGDPARNSADNQHLKKPTPAVASCPSIGLSLTASYLTSRPTDLRFTRKVVLAHHAKAVYDQRQQSSRDNHGKDEASEIGHLRSAFESTYRSPIWGPSECESPARAQGSHRERRDLSPRAKRLGNVGQCGFLILADPHSADAEEASLGRRVRHVLADGL
jgi:hypothetical protein